MPKYDFTEFLARSTDKPLQDTTLFYVLSYLPILRPYGPWIAGGSVRRTVLGQEPETDFDFFFKDEEQLDSFAKDLEGRNFKKEKETEHHIQYKGVIGEKEKVRSIVVQLIRFSYYSTIEEVIDSFDFTICQFAFEGRYLYTGDYSLWDLGRKRLAINNIAYPLSTMRRVLKYSNQGFVACNGCLTTILRSIHDNPRLLDQLHIQYID